jgi:hypothetical protein
MKPVAIVGNLAAGAPPYDNPDVEIWAFNAGAMHKGRLDVAFQMHEPPFIFGDEKKYSLESLQEYTDWLTNLTIPVYMREARPEYPTSIAYPFEQVLSMTKNITIKGKELRFLTSSPALALALAVLQNRPQIDLYGIEMMDNKEYRNQRECFAGWVMFAGGRGIAVNVNCAGSIFNKPIYGEVGV